MPKPHDMRDSELMAKIDEALSDAEEELARSKDGAAGMAFGAILDARAMLAALKARLDLRDVARKSNPC